jgi:hypothetical protein
MEFVNAEAKVSTAKLKLVEKAQRNPSRLTFLLPFLSFSLLMTLEARAKGTIIS